jgi:hypothetical protein
VVVGQAHLVRRAQHAVGPLAPHLATLDLHTAGHHRAQGRQRHQVADGHVERSASDLERFPVAGIHVDELDAVRIRVRSEREDARHHDALQVLADPGQLLDGEAEVAQLVGQDLRRGLERSELTQPRQEHLHG